MAAVVIEDNEIALNGTYFPLSRPIQSVLASIYPGKVVIGDTTRDSQLYSSIVSWSDWRGGIGVERMTGAADVSRAWYSTLQMRYNNHLVLPGLASATTSPSHSLSGATITAINQLGSSIYAVWSSLGGVSKVFKYAEADDDWEDSLVTINDMVTDSLVFTDAAGNTNLVFAHHDDSGSGYTYSANGSSWTTDTADTKFLAVWDERLWGISHAGQLWYSYTIGTETNDCKLPVPAGSVTSLFVARNAVGIPILYAATIDGLFAHDAENSRFIQTQMAFPTHPDNGVGTTLWRDSVYVPSGLGIYKYINGNNTAVITPVGPDRDDGLPTAYRGSVKRLVGTHNELFAGIDATSAPASVGPTSLTQNQSSGTNHIGSICIEPSTGNSSIIGYNETGWETKWTASESGRQIDAMHVSNLKSGVAGTVNYRVWWGFNNVVYHMELQRDIVNPSQLPAFTYASTGFLETPWFNAFQTEVDKLALQLKVEVQGASATETVKVEYAIDYDDTSDGAYTNLTSSSLITTNGVATYDLPTSASRVGVKFRSIKFRLTLARGSSEACVCETPDIVSMVLVYRKKLEAKWGHQVQIDLNGEYRGNNSKELRSKLIEAIESTTLTEFTFRDDSGGTRNYYVDVRAATGLEYSGYDERGTTTVTLVEP